jgi:molybdopterin-synthase adenylyltransferase
MENINLVFNPFSYLPSKKAIDHPAGMITKAAMVKGKPCLTFGGSWIGPLTIPHKTSCYFCAIKTLELNGSLDPEIRNQRIQKRAFAPPIATCCSMAVHEASRFLSSCDEPQILNAMIQLDMFAFSNSQYLPLRPSSDCCFCNACKTNNFKAAL